MSARTQWCLVSGIPITVSSHDNTDALRAGREHVLHVALECGEESICFSAGGDAEKKRLMFVLMQAYSLVENSLDANRAVEVAVEVTC